MSIRNYTNYLEILAFIREDDMVDVAEVVAADEDPGAAVAVREVLAEVAMQEIEEDSIVLPVAARMIALTNGPEAVVVAWAELATETVNRFLKTISGAELLAVVLAVIARTMVDIAEGVIGNKMAINSKYDKKMFQRLQGIIAIGDADETPNKPRVAENRSGRLLIHSHLLDHSPFSFPNTRKIPLAYLINIAISYISHI